MHKKLVALSLLASLFATPVLAEDESGWVLGPAFKEGWEADFTLALTANYIDPDISNVDGDGGVGMQVSLNCPWFQPPSGVIRQQFNLNQFDNDGIEFTTFEINPRYFVEMSPSVMLGVGPGFGYMWTDADVGKSDDMWTLQLGGDIEYRQGAFYLGAGARYMWTQDKDIGLTSDGADNWLAQLKMGVNF
ncbi:MAG: hypothetical protein PVG22_17700 [Chromatiales bacterium]|jgi:hypothetical protein